MYCMADVYKCIAGKQYYYERIELFEILSFKVYLILVNLIRDYLCKESNSNS